MTQKDSVFYCTGQIWKLWVLYVGVFITILLIVASEWTRGSLPAKYDALLMLSGISLGLVSVLFPFVAIKCPVCRAHWFWLAVSKQRTGTGIRWLFAQSACPVCGTSCQKFMEDQRSLLSG